MVFDIIFILIFLWAAFRGYSKGFIIQIASLIALFLGLFGAIWLTGHTTEFFFEKFHIQGEYIPLLIFILLFIAIVVCVHLVAKLVEKMVEAIALGLVNRLLGIFFSLIKYAFLLSIVLVILNSFHQRKPFLPEKKVAQSKLYRPLSALAPLFLPNLHFRVLPPINTPKIKPEEIHV